MSLEYNDQLANGTWQELRAKIFKRDNYCCTICGSTDSIQVHHKDYFPGKKPWEYHETSLTTLCAKHHRDENPRERAEYFLNLAMRDKGFMIGDVLCLSTLIHNDKTFTEALLNVLRKHQHG